MAIPSAPPGPDGPRPEHPATAEPAGPPGPAVDHCQAAHRRLLATVGPLDDPAVRRPSRLPGWQVAHVLTHLARNADSYVRMLESAAEGHCVEQYDGGPAARAADIEAGAGRPAAELVDDVARSIERLEAAWAAAPPTAWAGHGRNASGALWPCASFPRSRWREIEVHHVDLGLGYEPTDWPPEYVDLELPAAVADLPARLVPEDRARLLGWLLDRSAQPELELAGWQADPDRYHSTL